MFFRKSLAGLIIATLIVPLFPGDMWALSTGVVSAEKYPGKMDIKNVNGLGKNLSNDYFGGAMTFQYPFSFPSGSRGMTPSLGLSYSSNNSDAFSPYGYGFSLSTPRIQRSAKKGVSELYLKDEYVFDGQDLIREVNSSNQYRSKDMSDTSLYTLTASGGWMQNLSDGKTRIYGNNLTARITDPMTPSHIYAWLLDEERDQFGNAIKYQYVLDGGQPYISQISYGFDVGDTDALYQIRFEYISKTASLTSYRTQFEVSTKKLLSRVNLYVGGALIRGYECIYDTPNTPISHLTSITEVGASGERLPSITLSYGLGQYQHMIMGVDNHRGGMASFQYAPSTGYRTGSGNLQNSALPFVVQTLSKQVLTDTVTGISSTEIYSYGSGHYYYDSTDIWGREYVGFARVGIRDDKTDKTLFFHQSQTATPDPLKYHDNIAKKGRVYLTEIRDITSSKLLSRELTRYDMRTIANKWLVYPAYTISSMFGTDLSHKDIAVEYDVDDMGNTIRETRYGWVNANLENGTYIDIPGDTMITDRTYVMNQMSNLYGFVSTEKVTGFGGELMSSNRVEYDNTATGIIVGLPTAKIATDVITGDTVREVTRYSPRGLPIEKIDPIGNTSTFVYDDRNIAIARELNPLGWIVEYTYDYTLGKPLTTKNQNDVITKASYDIWGREVSRSRVNNGSEVLLMTHSYDDINIPNSSTETSYFTMDGDSKTTKQYTDGWGRTIMTTTSTEKLGQYSVSQVRYDDDGNPIYAGYPVFSASNNWDTSLVFSGVTDGEVYRNRYPGVSYQYDALDRIVSQRDARGVTTKSYTPQSESVTNALGATTRGIRDAYGNLISYVENINGRDIITNYSYDAFGRSIGLRDAYNNIRNWEYDGLGRLGKATDTHTVGDSTYGIRQYAYDILGRLIEYTNAKGEKVSYNYDTLSRLTKESYPTNGSGIWAREYTYDLGTRSLGTVSVITDPYTTVTYGYDSLGRKTSEVRRIQDETYTLGYDYNIASLLTNIVYPDGGKTDYKYKLGYIEGVDYTDPSGNLTNLITDISYAPNSMMQSVRYGNGVVKNTTRDPYHNYRLTRSTATLSGSTLLDTEYEYDAISNISKTRENGIEPLRKSIDYTYDALDRLTQANYVYLVSGYNRTNTPYNYTYDDIGNITSASNIGSYNYSGLGYANPHAVTTAGDTSYGYNEAGETISRTNPDTILSFAYSPYGEMMSSVKNGEETTYAYDQSHRRISKSTLGLTEHHVIDGYEVEYESGAVIEVENNITSPSEGSGVIQTESTDSGSTDSGSTSSGITQTGTTDSGSINTGSGETGTGSTGTGEMISTGSTNTGSTSTGTESIGSTDSGSIVTDTGSTNSGETIPENTGSTNTGETDSGTYMIIAGYESSTLSDSTPITLVTTLTHIMLGDEKIATFQSQTDDTPRTSDDDKLVYHISDYLNSSSLDLSSTGVLVQAVDYLPFGKENVYEVSNTRVKGKKGGYKNKYLFANKQQDDETDLQYFEKRYYDNKIGRFTTEDPVYWEVGKTKRPENYFTDPQQWNSYSYVRNNPINLVDPTGETIDYSKTYTDTRPKGGGQSYFQATNFSLQDGDTHYLSNNGTAIRVSFNEIDTSFITPRSFNAINNAINNGNPGTYKFEGDSAKQSFTTRTPKDYTLFGDLTFKTEGTLTISKDGSWSYDGVLKSLDDIYDFTVTKEDWASWNPLRQGRNIQTIGLDLFKYGLKGTPFYIQITGEKPLQGASTPTPQVGQGSTNRGQSSVSSVSLPKAKSTGRANLSNGPLLK